jgi:hypothetical protein
VANVEGGFVILGTVVLEDTDGVTTVDTRLDEELEDADDETAVELELEELDLLFVLPTVDDVLVERIVGVGMELFADALEELEVADEAQEDITIDVDLEELVLLSLLLAVADTLDGLPVEGRPVEGLYPVSGRPVAWPLSGGRIPGGDPGRGRTTGGTTAGGGGTVGGLFPGGGRPGGGLEPGDGRLVGVLCPGD